MSQVSHEDRDDVALVRNNQCSMIVTTKGRRSP